MRVNRNLRLCVALVPLVLGPATAAAQDPTQRTAKVVPERPARVFIMAAYNADCRSLPAPGLTVEKQPGKGTVSFRERQTATIQSSAGGTCSGAKVEGIGIYYTAAQGANGSDTFTIRAETPGGPVQSKTFVVEIASD